MDTQKRKSATGPELFNLIDADSIAEKTEDKFHSDTIKRRRFSERIAHYTPHAIAVIAIAAYILSAPFTVNFFGRITPDIILHIPFMDKSINFKVLVDNIAPIVIEGFIFVLSAVRQYKKDDKPLTVLLVSLLILSTLVNIIGGVAELEAVGIMNYIDKAYVGASVLAGILVSFVSYKSGGLVIELASGGVEMEIDSSKEWQGAVKYNALKRAFENAASEYTTVSRANKYALIMAKRYSEVLEIVEDAVDAIGNGQSGGQMIGSLARLDSQTSIPEMGFSPMARGNVGNVLSNDYQTDNSSKPVTTDKIRKMSKDNVIKWIENNPDAWQQWRIYKSMVANTKHIASQISEDGNTSGAKSVERAFKALEIEL